MRSTFILWVLTASCGACSNGFRAATSGPQPPMASASPRPATDSPKAPENLQTEAHTDQDATTIQEESNSIALPQYQACANLPQAGKLNYPARCAPNHVMTIINDGKGQEMTCCPLQSNDVLSNAPGDQWIERRGTCGPDEIGVGMIDADDSEIYCSKINISKYRLGPPVTALYLTTGLNLGPELNAIASSYNHSDCCICPYPRVMLGGHSPSNNRCEDLCVEILRR
jgi:hypothetical protein